jgi:hypothetical protein
MCSASGRALFYILKEKVVVAVIGSSRSFVTLKKSIVDLTEMPIQPSPIQYKSWQMIRQ